ncbi:ATP-binding protein [Neopusillimonas aromaticivorans]|uniref:ATP-binding protein n=1 Tax=Neopusillimonas aromaticivorans TaxID=2979868 RepID=UPI002591EF35|nr:ATP-binding protein [Neopusillimonas aromaticivorans]WJJ93342.1 ATP-binding protein [Neopusillimonas aromaticivorans]
MPNAPAAVSVATTASAGLPLDKHLEDFDYRHQTTITKRQVNALLDFGFIDNRENVVFIGPPGVGKTHLAIGIGQKAIQAGYKVLFRTALDLVEDLELAEMKGELKKRISQLAKFDMLIIDELGYLVQPDLFILAENDRSTRRVMPSPAHVS